MRVRGAAKIDAHAARTAGRLVVSGTVADDAGRPASSERVNLGITYTQGARGGGAVDVSTAMPEPCAEPGASGSTPTPVSLASPDRLALTVDPAGRFCVRLALPADRYVVHLDVRTSGLLDGSRLDWPLDLTLRPVSLRFDPERPVVSLDDAATDLEIVASIEEDGVTRGAPGLRIGVSNEAGEPLGDTTTAGSGRARLRVEAARLGGPGKGELRATFAGSTEAGATTCALAIERRSRVDLSATDADPLSRLPPGTPEDGIALRVVAVTRCAPSGCGGFPTGTVEARVGDAIVGAATLDHGQARLLATFARPLGPEVPLRIHYLPDAPWFLPGEELVLTQPLSSPSPWSRAPLGVAGLAILTWLAASRISKGRPTHPAPGKPGRTTGRHPVARVELLEALPEQQGWTGRVVDAHDGTLVGGARVAVERRGFEQVQVVAESRSDDGGRFALPAVEKAAGDEIVVEGPLHAQLRGPLPQSGDLRVALVLRRRAVLDRMIAWARRRGRPFDVRPEPTPAHVRRAAGAESPVGRWADAVERAAFGGEAVDERAHAEIDKLAPAAPAAPAGAEGADAADNPRAR